jgi:hypothetical protein
VDHIIGRRIDRSLRPGISFESTPDHREVAHICNLDARAVVAFDANLGEMNAIDVAHEDAGGAGSDAAELDGPHVVEVLVAVPVVDTVTSALGDADIVHIALIRPFSRNVVGCIDAVLTAAIDVDVFERDPFYVVQLNPVLEPPRTAVAGVDIAVVPGNCQVTDRYTFRSPDATLVLNAERRTARGADVRYRVNYRRALAQARDAEVAKCAWTLRGHAACTR